MQVLKEDIRGRILTVARQQFERKGYSKTSMREVAELAGVGVGNIYNYFTNKDELFREVVRPVLYALEAMLQEHHGIRGEDIMIMRSEKYLKSCIDEYVSLIDKHRALMEILLFRAQGSSLERFRENYTDRSTELVKEWFASMQQKHPEINTSVSDFIIHLHTVWMFTMFEELLMHSVPRQEMEAILHDQDMRYRQRTYKQSAASGRLAGRKSSRRFPPFFMNKSEYRSLINYNNGEIKKERRFVPTVRDSGTKERLAYIGRSVVRRKCGVYACALLGCL